ncbi:MAG: hypothetical protein AAF368_05740 [Planctomycetota bacterium]
MDWSTVGSQFCLGLAFGVLLALAFVPKAPVGRFFYQLMGGSAAVPLLLALIFPLAAAEEGQRASWSDPRVLITAVALLGLVFVSGFTRGRNWVVALSLTLAAILAALVLTVRLSLEGAGPGQLALASLSAAATGTVAGSVGLAMVLGHWYLTVPKLEVAHLVRLNRVTVAAMVASSVLVSLTCLVFADRFESADVPLFSPFGLFHFLTRVAVGLLLPLLFAWMTAGSLKFKNTRSATGILYASTVLVLIGAAASVTLQQSYGVPL